MTFFVLIGFLLAAYVAVAALRGEVWVTHRASARCVRRSREPVYFWVCIAIYVGLAVALVTVF